MNLVDILEMFCDWCCAIKRHKDASFDNSMEHNEKRFAMSPQLVNIFRNTYNEYEEQLNE